MTRAEFFAEYTRLGHAIQSGVAYEMNDPNNKSTDAKHLRVGINCNMCDHGSLVGLLIEKGLIDEQDYFAAILKGLREEIERYETRLNQHFGGGDRITLA
jgi:hypothetical protein